MARTGEIFWTKMPSDQYKKAHPRIRGRALFLLAIPIDQDSS